MRNRAYMGEYVFCKYLWGVIYCMGNVIFKIVFCCCCKFMFTFEMNMIWHNKSIANVQEITETLSKWYGHVMKKEHQHNSVENVKAPVKGSHTKAVILPVANIALLSSGKTFYPVLYKYNCLPGRQWLFNQEPRRTDVTYRREDNNNPLSDAWWMRTMTAIRYYIG